VRVPIGRWGFRECCSKGEASEEEYDVDERSRHRYRHRYGESRVESGRSGGVGVKVMTPASGATYYLGKRDERAREELSLLVLILAEKSKWHV
jgi:hypothetical protein